MMESPASLAASVRLLKRRDLPLDDYESALMHLAGLDPKSVGSGSRSVSVGHAKAGRLRDLETRLIALEERVRELEEQK